MRPLILIPCLLIAACSSEHIQAHMYRSGVPQSFQYAARDGDIHVAILNNPFSADRASVERSITESMTGHSAAQVKRFLAVPEGAAQPPARVVMLFNPPPAMSGLDLCEARSAAFADGAADGRLRLLASFCVGAQAQSRVTASMPLPAAPDDPRFRSLIGQTMLNLIPPEPDAASINDD